MPDTTCDIDQLLADGKCFGSNCITPQLQRQLRLQLLCMIYNNGATLVGGETASDQWLLSNVNEVQFLAPVVDADQVIVTSSVRWPDGSGGTFTRTLKNASFLTVDAWTLTHSLSGNIVTQSAVTRNTSGTIIISPALTVS